MLVDVNTGATISKVPITGYDKIEFGYFFNTKEFFYMDKSTRTEYTIKINDDAIRLKEALPITYYDI